MIFFQASMAPTDQVWGFRLKEGVLKRRTVTNSHLPLSSRRLAGVRLFFKPPPHNCLQFKTQYRWAGGSEVPAKWFGRLRTLHLCHGLLYVSTALLLSISPLMCKSHSCWRLHLFIWAPSAIWRSLTVYFHLNSSSSIFKPHPPASSLSCLQHLISQPICSYVCSGNVAIIKLEQRPEQCCIQLNFMAGTPEKTEKSCSTGSV